MFAASCRELQAGSLRSPKPKRLYILLRELRHRDLLLRTDG
jgi:hypothetical protein